MTGLNLGEQSDREQAKIQSLAFVLGICVCAAMSACMVFSYAGSARDRKPVVLDDKINPNVDTAASIARLPSLGATKAKAIVEYRSGGNGFAAAEDLDKVKGVGPKTVENVRPYLKFEK